MDLDMHVCQQGEVDYLRSLKQIELGWNEGDEKYNHVRKITINNEIVALLEFNRLIRDYIMEITMFEVIKDKRDKGIGSEIIRELQSNPDISVYQLLPRNEKSKTFWERMGFVEEPDGTGESIWIYRK